MTNLAQLSTNMDGYMQMDEKMKEIEFELPNRREAKFFWQVAVEHHTFFRLRDASAVQKSPITVSLLPKGAGGPTV